MMNETPNRECIFLEQSAMIHALAVELDYLCDQYLDLLDSHGKPFRWGKLTTHKARALAHDAFKLLAKHSSEVEPV